MAYGEAEDAGGLAPAKDDNEAARHFIRRTLPILNCVDYSYQGVGQFSCLPAKNATAMAPGPAWVLIVLPIIVTGRISRCSSQRVRLLSI